MEAPIVTCGLSQEKVLVLDERGRVPLENKRCQNERPDGTICGCPLSAHHSDISPPLGKRNFEHVDAIPTCTYFIVSAIILDSKSHSGYRKRIYQDAELHGALYDIRNPDCSIWYPEGSSDLKISLMFVDERDANKFMGCLISYNMGNTLMKGRLQINKVLAVIHSEVKGRYVHSDEYVFDDSDSPENTWDDIMSPTEVSLSNDPSQELRSLENLSLIPIGDTLYKCHIAPQKFYPEYKSDQDNIILGEHLFHTYFDGDGKRRPVGTDLDWGRPPRFKMEYESTGPSHLCQGTAYFMIRVLITFNDPAMARAMEGRWREGTTAHGDLQFRSYFYTRNVENCKKYLALKQRETENRWAELVEDIL